MRYAYERLGNPRTGIALKEELHTVSEEELWKLISGEEIDEVPNEIVFYNENLKNDRISFTLNTKNETDVERVYEAFSEFPCAGEMRKDGTWKFTVTYEKFYYRKVHKALMALGDIVKKIEPGETAKIIQKRRKNMEDRRNE